MHSFVNISPSSDLDYNQDEFVIVDLVDYPVIANPYTKRANILHGDDVQSLSITVRNLSDRISNPVSQFRLQLQQVFQSLLAISDFHIGNYTISITLSNPFSILSHNFADLHCRLIWTTSVEICGSSIIFAK